MADGEIIQLDSDPEDTIENHERSSATASVSIVNARPLDLSALGLGTGPTTSSSASASGQNGGSPLSQRQFMRAERAAGNRIKSKTNVSYTQQILPLSDGVPITAVASFTRAASSDSPSSASMTNGSFGSRNTRASARVPANRNSAHFAGDGLPMSADDIKEREQEKRYYEARLSRYTFEAYAKDNMQEDAPTMADASFRCTFGQCKRVIRGNVDFVCHIWAHLTTARGADKERNDLGIMSTCPQCIARFRTPNMMQVHYTRCHSRQKEAVQTGTCWICEKEVPRPKDMSRDMAIRAHLSLHDPCEAPYHCRRCNYRTTVRLHLFDHFAQKHNNTGMMMCPFCMFTIEIPSYKRKRTAIQAGEFVAHMKDHLRTRSGCGRCAAVFLYNQDKFDHQKKEHVPLPVKWHIQFRTPEQWNRPKAVWKLRSKKSSNRCRDCKKMDKGMCAMCLEEKYLKSAMARRLKLEELDIETERGGIDETQKDNNVYRLAEKEHLYERQLYSSCSCGYSTMLGAEMTRHRLLCSKDFTVHPRFVDKVKINWNTW
ncbi:hypothetical protein WR25_07836 isoform B [Diploscapter pachys]|uniref:C2H2-type domain-containing protein n=1 Tax=Diploscapter pachys TaxID=2018661 RepID=A0A2A2JF69_9BILA|nr:hypothetical protein WR25_07836 isoform B [Diploscapter pachys]